MIFVVNLESRSVLTPDNEEQPSFIFDVAVDPVTLAEDLAGYDPASGTSPSVTVARKYARAIFDAYLAAQGGGS